MNRSQTLRARLAQWNEFNRWEVAHPIALSFADRVASIGFVVDSVSRVVPPRRFDPRGVRAMHRALAKVRRQP
ncbi:MAG: hypothetical protein HYY84_06490 [Deltaproteobacteria bacterium]|nr:hypothetical protein [Deltaproteobacteria bacterium]